MSGTANNVTTGKPNNAGAVFMAPVGTAIPTDAVTALANTYIDLGFVSEDGVTEGVSISTTNIKEWGGGIVLVTQDEKTATLKFKLIEYLNVNVQKFVNGDDNVEGASLSSGIHIKVNDKEAGERVIVINQIMRNDTPFRLVIPRAKITEVGEVTYKSNEAVAYDVTVTAIKDANGDYEHKYAGGTSGT